MARRSAPPPRLPLVYLAFGHGALLLALLVAAIAPASIDTFFYQPRMFAVVHLVTLGWITHSILGATYLAAPMALRAELPAGKLDGWACAFVVIGASGVVAHFWIEGYSGVAYSGGMLLLAFGYLATRVLRALRGSGSGPAVRALVGTAYLDLLATAVYGTLLSINKNHPFLPGDHLDNVYAHAHFGLVGWGLLMFFGVGLRMLPMYLPAKPPADRSAWALLVLIEGGLIALGACWIAAPDQARWAALAPALGIAWFAWLVIGMLRNRLPAPPALRRPDIGMLHVLSALGYLVLATGTGLSIVFAERLDLGAVMGYGVFVLLGFFGQVILGIEMRLLPMYAWITSWTASGYEKLPVSPHERPVRPMQALSFLAWTIGVPSMAYGLWNTEHRVVSAAAWILIAGTLSATASTVRVLTRRTSNVRRRT
jgi:hypothetical protein